jgi:phosphatidate cytidylyltransferase
MNETLKRALSGAVYIILLIASTLYSTESFFVLFGIFLLIAVSEFCDLVQLHKIFPLLLASVTYFLFFKIATARDGLFFEIHSSNINELIVLFLTLFATIKCIILVFHNKQKPAIYSFFSKYVYLIGYVILPFIIITKIPFGIKGYNPKIIISIFVLIWTNDTFAYIVGKSIGRTKLLERISPKKTIEGFVGGVIFAIIASYLISKYYINPKENYLDKSIFIWMIIAVIVGVFGTIGDLVESKFKRNAGVKDSGKIMPGHGGILDRLDSVIFVAPIVFLFYQILNYVS